MTSISLVEISTIAHATEDLEKVVSAIKNLVPKELLGELEKNMEVLSMEGHYGNPLTRITVRFKGRGAREVARYIFSRLEKSDFETIIYTIDRRFDGKGRVFIRLSKQDAYLGKLRLYEREDVIRVMLTLPGVRSSEDVERILRQIRGE